MPSLTCIPDQVQVVWFISGLAVINRLDFARRLIDATQGSLDGDPVVLPLPEDAPNEIPIIILRSKDDKLQVNISRTRVDFLAREARARSADSTLALSHERLAEIGAILRSTGSAITRHALVTVWSAEPEKGGARYVIDNYLQPDPLVRNAANAE